MEGDVAGWKEQYFESRSEKTPVTESGLEGFLTDLQNSFTKPHRGKCPQNSSEHLSRKGLRECPQHQLQAIGRESRTITSQQQ